MRLIMRLQANTFPVKIPRGLPIFHAIILVCSLTQSKKNVKLLRRKHMEFQITKIIFVLHFSDTSDLPKMCAFGRV